MPRLLAVLLVALLPLTAQAKDLRNRWGIGFNQHFGGQSALSVRYGLPMPDPAMNAQLEAFGGFQTGSLTNPPWLVVGGRFLYGFVAEDNLNLYGIAGGGLLSQSNATMARVQPALGVEFFLFGLENLGFQTEWGVNIDVGNPTGVATTASAAVGVHYWF